MSSEETEAASPPWGSHPHGAKGLWALGGLTISTAVGHRNDQKPYATRWVEAGDKPRDDGAHVHQHLNFILLGKVPGRQAKASNRTMGNPAVRHYRGASGNVAVVEIPPSTAGAPELHPNNILQPSTSPTPSETRRVPGAGGCAEGSPGT